MVHVISLEVDGEFSTNYILICGNVWNKTAENICDPSRSCKLIQFVGVFL